MYSLLNLELNIGINKIIPTFMTMYRPITLYDLDFSDKRPNIR